MHLNPSEPIFTQADAAQCTIADNKTIDNYIQHGHAVPQRIQGRRRFSAMQMIEIEFTARLADLFKIPPSVGRGIAQALIQDSLGVIEGDARSIQAEPSWVRSAVHRGRVDRGETEIVFPVQMIARSVLQKAAALDKGTA